MIPTLKKEGSNATWRKSDNSGAGNDCVELGCEGGKFVGLGDTKNGSFISMSPPSVASFIGALQNGTTRPAS